MCRFKPRLAKSMLKEIMNNVLDGKEYDQNETGNWTREIATTAKQKLKGRFSAHTERVVEGSSPFCHGWVIHIYQSSV